MDPTRLTALEAATRLEDGSLTAVALTRACLERIAARDSIHAWAHVAAEAAETAARALDAGPRRGLLHGLPLGVKDIIDSVDQPSGYGSPIYTENRPAWDATTVALPRAAGAVIIGKTVTTEFANRHPGPTVNPHDPAHTPGGSSSGSAAAVADYHVPLALGTQTGGSVIRPASFCGVHALKPSFQHFGNAGVKTNTEAFDTVGVMARAVGDLALAYAALADVPYRPVDAGGITAPRIGIARTPVWDRAAPETRQAIAMATELLVAGGAVVEEFVMPDIFDGLLAAHSLISGYEAVRNLADELRRHRTRMSATILKDKLTIGTGANTDAFFAAQRLEDKCRRWIDDAVQSYDALLTPSAPGQAPPGLDWTGDPAFNFLWTAMYMPCVTFPAFSGPDGLPVGVQLVGRRHDDRRLLDLAAWADPRLRPEALA